MAVGVIIRRNWDVLASKLLPMAKRGASIAGLVWAVLCLIIYGKGLLSMAGSFAVVSELIFFGIVCVGTYWFGFGLRHEQRIVLSVGVTTRNLGACLAPLLSARAVDERATLMIVLALPIMVIVTLVGTKLFCRRAVVTAVGARA
jgi:BASS family bile acid:Na+ symporter